MRNGAPSVKPLLTRREMNLEVRTTFWGSLILTAAGVAVAIGIILHGPAFERDAGFFAQFAVQDLPGSLLIAGILLLAAVCYRHELVPLQALEHLDHYRRFVAVGLGILLAVGTLTVYHNHTLCLDEFSQLFQAKVFAKGRISVRYPPELLDWLLPRTQRFFLTNAATGEVMSGYWPGLSLLQTPFALFGAPWLLNPLLTVGTLLLIRRLAAELYPETNAPAWSLLFTLASPVFIVDGISYYGMPAQLFLNLLFTLLVLRMTPRALLGAGIVGSFALLQTNPIPHTFYAIPWLLWVVTRRNDRRSLLWLCAGYLPLCISLGLGSIALRAHIAASSTPGVDTFGDYLGGLVTSTLTTSASELLLVRGIGLLKLATWAMPGLLILSILGARNGWTDTRIKVLAASALVTFFGYFLFRFSQGHGWGYRYFHGAWGTLPLLACGVVAGAGPAGNAPRRMASVAHFSAALAVSSLLLLNGLRLFQVDDWITRHLAQLPPLDTARPQVCFVRPEERGSYRLDLVQNDPLLRQRTLFLKSHGRETERPFMAQYFPGAVPRSSDPNEAVWYVERDRIDWWVHGGQ